MLGFAAHFWFLRKCAKTQQSLDYETNDEIHGFECRNKSNVSAMTPLITKF